MVDLISLLPSRVSIHGVNLFGVDGVGSDPSTPVSFEHQLVTSGSPPDTIRLNVDLSIDHDIRVKVDEDLDDLFGDTEDLF